MRILLIEDDSEAAAYMAKGLKEAGHVVDHAATGTDGLFLATSERWDAMIVDRMLPGLDGLAIIQAIRAAGNTTTVLPMTSSAAIEPSQAEMILLSHALGEAMELLSFCCE